MKADAPEFCPGSSFHGSFQHTPNVIAAAEQSAASVKNVDLHPSENPNQQPDLKNVNEQDDDDTSHFDTSDSSCDESSDNNDSKISTECTKESSADPKQEAKAAKIDTTTLVDPDPRPHLNVVFIGHVDAGKSTTCGNILVLSGQVDARMLEKYEREAKEKHRESWYYAFIMDINEEERQKGKTIEVGRGAFDRPTIRFTILDAPGHKNFVPNMISGAAQADVAVLIASARKGEFETGFEKGGQTREHILLAKTLGVSYLIVAVNKMDDLLCDWEEERYLSIQKKLLPFIKKCGFNPEKQVKFIPISGLKGYNIENHVSTYPELKDKASWYKSNEPTLFDILDNLEIPERDPKAPFRVPLLEGYRDLHVMAMGKIECGTLYTNESAVLMPQKIQVKIVGIYINDLPVAYSLPGENVTLKLTGCVESAITRGSVLCPPHSPCLPASKLKAQVIIVDLLEHRPIITIAYSCIIHTHTAIDECYFSALYEAVDRTSKKKKVNPQFVRSNSIMVCELTLTTKVSVELYAKCPQLGRFTLRDEGKTIAVGKILDIPCYAT